MKKYVKIVYSSRIVLVGKLLTRSTRFTFMRLLGEKNRNRFTLMRLLEKRTEVENDLHTFARLDSDLNTNTLLASVPRRSFDLYTERGQTLTLPHLARPAR